MIHLRQPTKRFLGLQLPCSYLKNILLLLLSQTLLWVQSTAKNPAARFAVILPSYALAQLPIHCFDTAMAAPMRVGWALRCWFNDILNHLSQNLPHISSTDRPKPPRARPEFKQSFFAQQLFFFPSGGF